MEARSDIILVETNVRLGATKKLCKFGIVPAEWWLGRSQHKIPLNTWQVHHETKAGTSGGYVTQSFAIQTSGRRCRRVETELSRSPGRPQTTHSRISASCATVSLLTGVLRLSAFFPAHGFTLQLDPIGVMNDAVQKTVGDGQDHQAAIARRVAKSRLAALAAARPCLARARLGCPDSP
jgi:hypothetical protein